MDEGVLTRDGVPPQAPINGDNVQENAKGEPKTSEKKKPGLKNPWAGRFTKAPDPLLQRYTRSIHIDKRLAEQDLRGSCAHVRMLASQGLLSEADEKKLLDGLALIAEELAEGRFPFKDELEDIHMNIECRLTELVGEVGERLHTGRSRNDQVALDLRLYCLEVASDWRTQLVELVRRLHGRAAELKEDLFPAWTHLQAAQPVSWGHYLLAFAEMFRRDFDRLGFYGQLHSVGPLGAGALSGSSLPLDPEKTARELGFSRSFSNSYDVVGDRDVALEMLQVATQIMLHLSRLAEDFIYFSSTPVSWIELPDDLCTGSSMMPQKKNPDILELMRGKTASVIGHANALTVLLKGLPTSYHRDLQQDKEHLFGAVDIVTDSLEILVPLLEAFQIRQDRVNKALAGGYLMATELAEYLVEKGMPFRRAHERVGALVGHCVREGLALESLPLEVIQRLVPECESDVAEVLQPRAAFERRRYKGASGRSSVEQQLCDWEGWLRQSQG